MTPTPQLVAAQLKLGRWQARDERALQDAVERVLREAFGDAVRREVDLFEVDEALRPTSVGRVDFLVGEVGVELKMRGSRASVLRQVQRYLGSPLLSSIVVASTKPTLLSNWPHTLAGKLVAPVVLRTWL